MAGLYHYTESGLDFVYLENGYEISDTPRGRNITIHDIDGLHRAIGEFLIENRKHLSGKEVRFLRTEMGMSQDTLAKLLEVNVQAVHRWEKGKSTKVPKPADTLIRLLYREHIGGNTAIKSVMKRIAELEDEIYELQLTQTPSREWRRAA